MRSCFRGIAQLGRALALGARGRRFESGCPDQQNFKNELEHSDLKYYLAGIAQLVERQPSKLDARVRVSLPALTWACSSMAEQAAHNRLVLGSNPGGPTSAKF